MDRTRIFLDSCVLIEGLIAPWSASRGVLLLGRAAVLQIQLAEIVVVEVERALLHHAREYGSASHLSEDYQLLLRKLRVERIPHATREEFLDAKPLIRHVNDVPVLAAAIRCKPDWLLTANTKHFDTEVGKRTGLAIATPQQFLKRAGRMFTNRAISDATHPPRRESSQDLPVRR